MSRFALATLLVVVPLVCALKGEAQELQVSRAQAWQSAFAPKPEEKKDAAKPASESQTPPKKRHYWGFRRSRTAQADALLQLDDVAGVVPAATTPKDQSQDQENEIDDAQYCHETRVANFNGRFVRFCYFQGTTNSVATPSAFTSIRPQTFGDYEPVSKLMTAQTELKMTPMEPDAHAAPATSAAGATTDAAGAAAVVDENHAVTKTDSVQQSVSAPRAVLSTPSNVKADGPDTPSLTTDDFAKALKTYKAPSRDALKALSLDAPTTKVNVVPEAASAVAAAAPLDDPADYVQANPTVIEDEKLRVKVEQLERKLRELESSLSSQKAPQAVEDQPQPQSVQQPQQQQQQQQQQTLQVQPQPQRQEEQQATQQQQQQQQQRVEAAKKTEKTIPQAEGSNANKATVMEPDSNESINSLRLKQKIRSELETADIKSEAPPAKVSSSSPSTNSQQQKTAENVNVAKIGLMDANAHTSVPPESVVPGPAPVAALPPAKPTSSVSEDVRVDDASTPQLQPSTDDSMPLVADMEFFPEQSRHHKVRNPTLKSLWDFSTNIKDEANPDAKTGSVSTTPPVATESQPQQQQQPGSAKAPRDAKSFMDDQTLLQTHHTFKPSHIFDSLFGVSQLVSAFTFSTNMLELDSATSNSAVALTMPMIAGAAAHGAYHTPQAFGWHSSDAAQAFALDVPDEFNHVRISGSFSLGDTPSEDSSASASTSATTIEWAVLSKRASGVEVHASGSFDVENGTIKLARQGQFYRRVSTGVVSVTVGQEDIHVENVDGAIVMLWMKPSQACSLQVQDKLLFTFT